MSEEVREKLPLELLMEKYIPVTAFPDKFNIPVAKVMSLVNENRIRKAEFRVPGDRRRTLHVNYEEVFRELEKEKDR